MIGIFGSREIYAAPRERSPRSAPVMALSIVGCFIATAALGSWAIQSPRSIPTIEPLPGASKILPENPGGLGYGMDDQAVMRVMSGSVAEGSIEAALLEASLEVEAASPLLEEQIREIGADNAIEAALAQVLPSSDRQPERISRAPIASPMAPARPR